MKTWVVATTFIFLGSCLFFLHRSKLPFRLFSCQTELACAKKINVPNASCMQDTCGGGKNNVSHEQRQLIVKKQEPVNDEKKSLLAKNNTTAEGFDDSSNALELMTKEFDIKKEKNSSCRGQQKKYQKKKTIVLEKSKSRNPEAAAQKKLEQHTVVADNKEVVSAESRIITIRNRVSPEMTAYKHWTGTYTPSLKVFINETELSQNQEKKLTVAQNKITIGYHYDFMKGIRKGGDNISIDIPAQGNTFDINFSWDSKPRITLSSVSV